MRKKSTLHRIAFLVISLASIILVLGGCSGQPSPPSQTVAPTTSPPAPTSSSPSVTPSPSTSAAPQPTSSAVNYTVNVASKANIGNYLVDGRGMALYYTKSDSPGKSTITDELLKTWPVFYVPTIVVPPALKISDFGTITRDLDKKQTTFRGWPLYYLSADKAPGDTLGNGVSGVWFVVNPDQFPP